MDNDNQVFNLERLFEKAEKQTAALRLQLGDIQDRFTWLEGEAASLKYPAGQGDATAESRLEDIRSELSQLETETAGTEKEISAAESERATIQADLNVALLIEAAGRAKQSELKAIQIWFEYNDLYQQTEKKRADYARLVEAVNEAAAEVRRRGGSHPGHSEPVAVSNDVKQEIFERKVIELGGKMQPAIV